MEPRDRRGETPARPIAEADGTTPGRSPCTNHHAGHAPHWIQVFHSRSPDEEPPVIGRLLEASDDGTVVVSAGGRTYRLCNHQPPRLPATAAANDGEIALSYRWKLLRTRHESGWACFSVCAAEDGGRGLCAWHRD